LRGETLPNPLLERFRSGHEKNGCLWWNANDAGPNPIILVSLEQA
jgi:hypothetical protein